MAQWYYMQDGQAVGPVSHERIKQLVDARILTPDSAVRYEGGEWTQLHDMPEFHAGGRKHEAPSGTAQASTATGSTKKYAIALLCVVLVLSAAGFVWVLVSKGTGGVSEDPQASFLRFAPRFHQAFILDARAYQEGTEVKGNQFAKETIMAIWRDSDYESDLVRPIVLCTR